MGIQLESNQIIKEETDYLIHLVEKINNCLTNIMSHNINQNNKFGNSQIRNLLTAAKEASGTKEMILFIQYQMGRDERNQNWNKKIGNQSSLGDAVIQTLKQLETRANERANGNKELQDILVVKMMQRFFMYMSWKYKYYAINPPKIDNYQNNNSNKGKHNQNRYQTGGRK